VLCRRAGYRTFGKLGGLSDAQVEDGPAKAASLPPVDSIDQRPLLLGSALPLAAAPPRTELPLGSCGHDRSDPFCQGADPGNAIVQGVIAQVNGSLYKLLVGAVPLDCLTGPHYPNTSVPTPLVSMGSASPLEERRSFEQAALQCPWRDCGAGCLFNLSHDPTESIDLTRQTYSTRTSAHGHSETLTAAVAPRDPPRVVAALLKHLQERIRAYNATVFSPNRGVDDLSGACDAARHRHGGFWGPFAT
jgi:hypothetical protein